MTEPLGDDALARLLNMAAEEVDEEIPLFVDERYRLIRELGRGGMGVVFEGEDVRLQRRVAIKLLSGRGAWDARARQRFTREALTAARLRHPNIAAIYDATPTFIAMRLVEGVTIDQLGAGDLKVRVQLLRDAANAVQHAHEQGIVHRDLKPGNLMVETTPGEGATLFVMDFGLAKERTADTALSMSGDIMGTPTYMSPEQAVGRLGDVDERSDVYGLGATLYTCVTDRLPFAGNSDLIALLRRVAEEEPTPPRRCRPDVDGDLDAIIRMAMAKDPKERYPTARALAEDLGRWLAGDPIVARPPSPLRIVRRIARRRRGVIRGVAVTMFLLVSIGLPIYLRERGEREGAEYALRLSGSVSALVSDADDAFMAGDVAVSRDKLFRAVALCREFVVAHDAPQGHYLLGSLLFRLKEHAAALRALERAVELDENFEEARFLRGLVLLEYAALPVTHGGPVSLVAGHLIDQARNDLKVHERSELSFRQVDVLYGEARLAVLDQDREVARTNLESIVYRLDPYHVGALRCLAELTQEIDVDQSVQLSSRALDLESGHAPRVRDLAGGGAGARVIGIAGIGPVSRCIDRVPTEEDSVTDEGVKQGIQTMRTACELRRRGEVHEALQTWHEAIETFSRLATERPTLAGLFCNRGIARGEIEQIMTAQGKGVAAITARMMAKEDFETALMLDPISVPAHLHRAALLRRMADHLDRGGLPDEARQVREEAVVGYEAALRELPPVATTRDQAVVALNETRAELGRDGD